MALALATTACSDDESRANDQKHPELKTLKVQARLTDTTSTGRVYDITLVNTMNTPLALAPLFVAYSSYEGHTAAGGTSPHFQAFPVSLVETILRPGESRVFRAELPEPADLMNSKDIDENLLDVHLWGVATEGVTNDHLMSEIKDVSVDAERR